MLNAIQLSVTKLLSKNLLTLVMKCIVNVLVYTHGLLSVVNGFAL